MNNLFKIILLIFSFNACFFINTNAQKTAIYNNPEAEYSLAMELFNKEKYGAAQQEFVNIIETINDPLSEIRINAEYYDAICAFELFNKDAEYKLTEFIKNHPANSKVKLAYFQLGKFEYRNKKYRKAIKYFNKADLFELNNNELAEYYFKIGYSYFCTKDYEKAKEAFFEIKDKNTRYSSPANYYYAHIAYTDKNYETALIGFQKLSDDENFKSITPYYIVQIYFLQEKYDELLKTAPSLLEKATAKRVPEIARMTGESYFRTSRYEEAIPYLEKYSETSLTIISREDYYRLGYSYYKTSQYDKAIGNFQEVVNKRDSLSQNAYYHLGECYLKTKHKQFAANAFLSAYKLPFDKEIKEDALFKYAKLSYELSYDPYSEAIKALKKYLKNYPNSSRNDEAYSFLVNIAMSTKNYKDALYAIESIKNQDENLKATYQKITYYRGIELFNENNFKEAIKLFKKSIKNDIDRSISAESNYWIGECFYRLSNYWGAEKYYNEFLISPGAFSLPKYNIANYNLGYVYFKKKEYSKAITSFRKFIDKKENESQKMVCDAYLRIGDSYFINKKYDNAIAWYDKAINMNILDVDYALYQRALALGVLGRYDEKIIALQTIINEQSNSAFADDAEYELASTYLTIKNNEKALIHFKEIVEKYPSSSYEKKSRLKIGLIYYNNGENDLALNTFKKIVDDYPATPESNEALVSIRNIYVDINKVDDFFIYVQGLSFADVTTSGQDSITYIAAENLYMNGNCKSSVKAFENYIENFPEGIFLVNANYYKAECELKIDSLQQALQGYNFVINKPKSNFTENSLLKAAKIYFTLENYKEAYKNFYELEKTAEYKNNIIEALNGQMKCNYLLEKYEPAINSAKKLLAAEKVSNNLIINAHLIIAQSYLTLENYKQATTEFETIIGLSQGKEAAEAKYYLAYIQFTLEKFKEAEKMVFELINQYSSHDFWVAKGFILLSDIYEKTENIFQAKQTLQSIIDNYEGAVLVQIAKEKLNNILEAEKAEIIEKEKLIENDTIQEEDFEIQIEDIEQEDSEAEGIY
ncbi:MAG: tetratricopeptide repeat protein [Bacteroidales bacterium]|nr:tetratricopeptide repeat protein [Bacteroidales bacterium]